MPLKSNAFFESDVEVLPGMPDRPKALTSIGKKNISNQLGSHSVESCATFCDTCCSQCQSQCKTQHAEIMGALRSIETKLTVTDAPLSVMSDAPMRLSIQSDSKPAETKRKKISTRDTLEELVCQDQFRYRACETPGLKAGTVTSESVEDGPMSKGFPKIARTRPFRLTEASEKQAGFRGKSINSRVSVYMDKFRENIEETRLRDKPRAWYTRYNAHFNAFCGIAIVVNSFFIGLQSSIELRSAETGENAPGWITYSEVFFVCFFTLEIGIRASAERMLFIFGVEWRWNAFDVFLLSVSYIDAAWGAASPKEVATANLSIGRVLRVIRFVRLARVIRMFRELRLMFCVLLETVSNLLSCFVVIGLVLMLFNVFFMNAAASHITEVGAHSTDPTTKDMMKFFGGTTRSFTTLFMIITGGVDWWEVHQPLEAVHTVYGMCLLFYVFAMQFGVLNIVVGTFVASSSDVVAKDRDALVKSQMNQHEVLTNRIRTFFTEADTDGSNTLTWEEFQEHLQTTEVKAYFRSLDLDVNQAHELFGLLDADGSNQVTIDEFLAGCLRLKGHARATDICMLTFMCKKVFREIISFMDSHESHFEHVRLIASGDVPLTAIESIR